MQKEIANSKTRYRIRFIDSVRFMASSAPSLTDNLHPVSLIILMKDFKNVNAKIVHLILR